LDTHAEDRLRVAKKIMYFHSHSGMRALKSGTYLVKERIDVREPFLFPEIQLVVEAGLRK